MLAGGIRSKLSGVSPIWRTPTGATVVNTGINDSCETLWYLLRLISGRTLANLVNQLQMVTEIGDEEVSPLREMQRQSLPFGSDVS